MHIINYYLKGLNVNKYSTYVESADNWGTVLYNVVTFT